MRGPLGVIQTTSCAVVDYPYVVLPLGNIKVMYEAEHMTDVNVPPLPDWHDLLGQQLSIPFLFGRFLGDPEGFTQAAHTIVRLTVPNLLLIFLGPVPKEGSRTHFPFSTARKVILVVMNQMTSGTLNAIPRYFQSSGCPRFPTKFFCLSLIARFSLIGPGIYWPVPVILGDQPDNPGEPAL